jgi:hypothetical protein
MSEPEHYRGAIPGPDPGACPRCGTWRKAGMAHDCERERERTEVEIASAIARMNREKAEAEAATIARLVAEGKVVASATYREAVGALRDLVRLVKENKRLREWIAASSVAMQARDAGLITREEYGDAQRRHFGGR